VCVSLAGCEGKRRLSNREKNLLFGLGDVFENDIANEEERKEKSLINSFPFKIDQASNDNDQNHNHGAHGEHGHHQEHHDNRRVSNPSVRKHLSSRTSGNPKSQHSTLFPFKNFLNRQIKPEDTVESAEVVEEKFEEEESVDQTPLSFNTVGEVAAEDEDIASGRKCIDKVIMTEETVYDEVITCDHSYDKRCHTSYVTNYESQQEEECKENFKKSCYIDYEPLAYNETVEVCRTPVVKDCNQEGPEVCRTIYESECWTKQIVHEVEDDVTNCQTVLEQKCKEVTVGYTTKDECEEWPVEKCSVEKKLVKKVTPETGCHKEPVELCAPKGCGFSNGPVSCHNRVKTIVVDKPIEECNIEPIRSCKHITKLVPKLVPVQECIDVPKEICARSKTNPQKIKKPVVKKWCYVPSKESGLQK